MIYKQSQKLESDVQLMQYILIGIWMAPVSLFRSTLSRIVLSAHVINNLGTENEDFLNGKRKGMLLYPLFMKGLLSDESCGPAVFPPAKLLLNLIELTGYTSHREGNLIFISVHLIS